MVPNKKSGLSSGNKDGNLGPVLSQEPPSGIPLIYTLLCGMGLVLLLCGTLVSNFTVQTETEPVLYDDTDDTEREQWEKDHKEYDDDTEKSNQGLRNGVILYNLGLFSLLLGLLGGAFFAPDIRWELRTALVLTAGIILGFGNFITL